MPESLGSLITDSSERLRRAGIPEPRRQALRIWSELNAAGPAEALLEGHRAIPSSQVADFREAILRRAGGEPVSYVTGWAGFRHQVLRSDRRALIPRAETEGLVDLLLQRVRSGAVADVGTGGGCIALSLALEGAFNHVIAIDCSGEALALARVNAELLEAATKVAFVQADFCTTLRPDALDALISNPPYLTAGEYESLDRSVRDWEPALALRSAQDGLEATIRLLEEGQAALRPGGWLALEVDCSRADLVARLAGERGWQAVSIHMDLFGRERYLLAQRSETR
jgi:release factor glutamine methyltransferase